MMILNNKYSHLNLKVLDVDFSYVLFENSEQMSKAITSLTKNDADYLSFSFMDEKSLICKVIDMDFAYFKSQDGWIGVKIEGEMPFGTVQGLISSISSPLAKEGLGVCVISTFLTDLFLVKKTNIEKIKKIVSTNVPLGGASSSAPSSRNNSICG